MPVRIFCACLLLFGCAKRTAVEPLLRPTYSADRTYGYYQSAPGEWIAVSKTGPHAKELCPHGAVCTVETVGTMYRVRRVH